MSAWLRTVLGSHRRASVSSPRSASTCRRRGRRPFCRTYIDWSERRLHLSGELGAALCRHCLALGWIERQRDSRAVKVTEAGATWAAIGIRGDADAGSRRDAPVSDNCLAPALRLRRHVIIHRTPNRLTSAEAALAGAVACVWLPAEHTGRGVCSSELCRSRRFRPRQGPGQHCAGRSSVARPNRRSGAALTTGKGIRGCCARVRRRRLARVCGHSFESQIGAGEMDHGAEAGVGFVVACCDAAGSSGRRAIGRWPDFESPPCAGTIPVDPDDGAVDDRVLEVRIIRQAA